MKFKVGDRVRGNEKANKKYSHTVQGWEGVVKEVYEDYFVADHFDLKYECFELIESKTLVMSKLNAMMKLMLGKDEQTLYKAGFINGDLKHTEKGQEHLNALLFAAHKVNLVKLAEEEIEEEKKAA
jgi:hypothetical protein